MKKTAELMAEYAQARTVSHAAGKTLATIVEMEIDAGVELPQQVLRALKIHQDAIAAEEVAYEALTNPKLAVV